MDSIIDRFPRIAYDATVRLFPGLFAIIMFVVASGSGLGPLISAVAGGNQVIQSSITAIGAIVVFFGYIAGLLLSGPARLLEIGLLRGRLNVVHTVLEHGAQAAQLTPEVADFVIEAVENDPKGFSSLLIHWYDVIRSVKPEARNEFTRTRAEIGMFSGLAVASLLAMSIHIAVGFANSASGPNWILVVMFCSFALLFSVGAGRANTQYQRSIANAAYSIRDSFRLRNSAESHDGSQLHQPEQYLAPSENPRNSVRQQQFTLPQDMTVAVICHKQLVQRLHSDSRFRHVDVLRLPNSGRKVVADLWKVDGQVLVTIDRYQTHGERKRPSPQELLLALGTAGVSRIISWNGVGSLREDWAVNHLVQVSDFVRYGPQEEDSRFAGMDPAPYVRFNPPLCPVLSAASLRSIPEHVSIEPSGVYAHVPGPRLDTPAEVRRFRSEGNDIVGMRLATEAIIARELEIHYAAIGFIINMAEGVGSNIQGASLMALKQTLNQQQLVETQVEWLASLPTQITGCVWDCPCGDALQDFRNWMDVAGSATTIVQAQ